MFPFGNVLARSPLRSSFAAEICRGGCSDDDDGIDDGINDGGIDDDDDGIDDDDGGERFLPSSAPSADQRQIHSGQIPPAVDRQIAS